MERGEDRDHLWPSGLRSDLPPILWTPGYATAAFASNSAGD